MEPSRKGRFLFLYNPYFCTLDCFIHPKGYWIKKMSKTETVKSNLEQGYNCAQAILAAFAGDYGMSRDLALKLSLNLGGGCAFRGEICGAVSTALLIYGLHFGSEQPVDELSQEIVFHLSSDHIREFKQTFGTITCRELLGRDIGSPDDFAMIMENDLFRLKCPKFILDSVRILERNIEEAEEKFRR